MSGYPALAEIVGRALRAAREDGGVTRDQVAAALASVGVRWTTATIGKIESGARPLTIDEFVALALVLFTRFGCAVSLPKAARETRSYMVDVAGLGVFPAAAGAALAGSLRGLAKSERDIAPRAEFDHAVADGRRDAERKAAHRLGVSGAVVALASYELWDGRSLSTERDRRLAALEPFASPRSRQAARGHLTRALIAELRVHTRPAELRSPVLTTEEVAQLLKVSIRTIYKWRQQGDGPPAVRVGRHLRYRRSAVFAWLDGQPS